MAAASPRDRYKASSYAAYNLKLPKRYDTSIAVRLLRPSIMDDFVVGELCRSAGSLAILDVGCATGRLLVRLARAGAWWLAGTDLAPRILDVAQAKLDAAGAAAELRCADAEERLPCPGATFDVVALTGVLHHFSRPGAALAEVQGVLRPGGRLVVADACFFWPLRKMLNLGLRIHPPEGDFHFYASAEARAALGASPGWEVVSEHRLNWWAYGIVASRVEVDRAG